MINRRAHCCAWAQQKLEESLGLAVAGATGVSGGSAHNIPSLLLPKEVGGRKLTDVADTKRISDAMINETPCYRIRGTYADDPITIWIDQETHLVRRIDTQSEFDDFTTEETTVYDPVIDKAVDPRVLEYDAP